MTELFKPIARTLDDSPRLLGMSPFELGSCVVAYATLSTLLRGVPFSALFSLGAGLAAGLTLRIVNLTRPPDHALHWIVFMFRPAILPVMGAPGKSGDSE